VNNLFKNGWVDSVLLSSFIKKSVRGIYDIGAQRQLTQPSFHLNQPTLSTRIMSIYNLLNNSYTHNPQGLLLKQQQKN
jgi:hypothetical protein